MKGLRKLATIGAVAAVAFGASGPAAFAGGEEPPPKPDSGKCNSGNGNGSDFISFVAGAHCYGGDPGNSYNAGNRGGDEQPTSNGVNNPGGNNVP